MFSLELLNGNVGVIKRHLDFAVWDEITYPFPDLNDNTVEVWVN